MRFDKLCFTRVSNLYFVVVALSIVSFGEKMVPLSYQTYTYMQFVRFAAFFSPVWIVDLT